VLGPSLSLMFFFLNDRRNLFYNSLGKSFPHFLRVSCLTALSRAYADPMAVHSSCCNFHSRVPKSFCGFHPLFRVKSSLPLLHCWVIGSHIPAVCPDYPPKVQETGLSSPRPSHSDCFLLTIPALFYVPWCLPPGCTYIALPGLLL